jgi:regulator of replication initiation timing
MLNWRRDPGYEQRKMQSEWRMKQLESEILLVRKDSEQIKSETEQLRRENARLKLLNARERALSALIKQHCFPPECSSTPPQPTEIDCGPSSP